LGRRLPLAALFRGATLASLAAEIRSAPWAEGPLTSPLVPLREEGTGSPLFWFHPLGGRTLCYADLARHFPGRPLYGLEAEENGREPGATSLEDLAGRYAAALAVRQPRGPYLLAGWSFGGVVAWETARRLEESGEEVALLVLVDARPPSPGVPAESTDEDLEGLLRAELAGAGAAALTAALPVLR